MNDAPPKAGTDGGAPLREPLTIADAARRAGVHPNTIRRLIRQERVAARLVRGRYGDTWLVESADIDRAVGGHSMPGGATSAAEPAPGPSQGQSTWSSTIDSPDFLPAGTDLSLDRARALERYTHGLLQPLVDLLREREAALESRDTLIRTQAERIGRLERELELVREARVSPQTAPSPTAWPVPIGPLASRVPAAAEDDLPEHVSTLASQVGRLRAELQLIATALRPDEGETVAERVDAVAASPDTDPELEPPPESRPNATSSLDSAPSDSPSVAPSVTPEELASLFPSASRGRLVLRPLDGNGEIASADASDASTRDPFAQAEAAVQELRRALAPTGSGPDSASAAPPAPPAPAPPPVESPQSSEVASDGRSRRWWWPW